MKLKQYLENFLWTAGETTVAANEESAIEFFVPVRQWTIARV